MPLEKAQMQRLREIGDEIADRFTHPSDFETERNRIGGLLLMQRGINQSLNDATYEDKRDAYAAHGARHMLRLAFWTRLLKHAKTRGDLHANISPSRYNWVGRCREGMWWNYTVVQDETRAELYIDSPEPSRNKALYDALITRKAGIENAFGGPLLWQRLDDKRACRISTSVRGGWVDETTWPQAIEQAVDGMERLYAALAPLVSEIRGKT